MQKTILITGATDGIGLETAKIVVSHGHNVLVHGRNPAKLEEVLEDIDFVLDGMGGEVLENSLKVIKDGGTIVSLPTHEFSKELKAIAKQHNIKLEFVLVTSSGDDMNTLKEYMESGALKPHVSMTFPFDQMSEAHKQIESGRTIGKAVVTL